MTKGCKRTKRLTWDMPTPCSHLSVPLNDSIESIDPTVNVAISNCDLEKSVKRGTAETLTWEVVMQSG